MTVSTKNQTGWFDGMLFKGARTKLLLKVKQDVELDPKSLLVFLHAKNVQTVNILGGSGDFKVTTNGTKLSKVHRSNRVTRITPLQVGTVSLTVQDTSLLKSTPAKCLIKIANIARLDITPESFLVEQGHSTVINVEAFDRFGEKLPSNQ